MKKFKQLSLLYLSLIPLSIAQSCENYGTPNGTSCACPVGFYGSTCSQPGCGGTIFQGSQRPLTPLSGNFANLTAAGCNCEDGWTGTGCNVCTSSGACQSAFGSGSTDSADVTGGQLQCNTAPRVWAAGQMSCSVDNPTLKALYPLQSTLTIQRSLQPNLSPLPNTTSFGSSGSAYAQLFYDGVEQFYCHADSCTQDFPSDTSGGANWECNNLQCTCRPNATFCGAVPVSNLTGAINNLSGTLGIECGAVDASNGTASCNFKQDTLRSLFGSNGLSLTGCIFGECVSQTVVSSSANSTSSATAIAGGSGLGGGVIAGLAVVGALVAIALLGLLFGLWRQRVARKRGYNPRSERRKVGVEWRAGGGLAGRFMRRGKDEEGDKVVLDGVSGRVMPGQMMAILGPSGAGKTTLVELLASKSKSGVKTGSISFPLSTSDQPQRIGFVPQQDILPATLTVSEALLFAARLRLPESVSDEDKKARVEDMLKRLGIESIKNSRIGGNEGHGRGISGGEMRRVSIGLELIADPDVLILDEPTSGLDSVSASRIASVLHALAHDPVSPIPVIASIHQPSSQLYHKFDTILLLAHGRALYSGPGGIQPVEYMKSQGVKGGDDGEGYKEGYNVADYLLEVASDPPVGLFRVDDGNATRGSGSGNGSTHEKEDQRNSGEGHVHDNLPGKEGRSGYSRRGTYATTFLTQLQCLSGREWKVLRRDHTLFLTHIGVSCILGVFCGGLYFNTDITIAGFQSRVGCLFFLGALIAFSSLSALYNIVELRPLFLRERSSGYYSPTAWLLSRFIFDIVPLRLIPTIIVSTITYWMAGLAPHPANFFKFLFILVLFSMAMALYNFLLGTLFRNGGIAILLSALSALYQMTFAGFFVHLNDIPPVLRWLQWLCPLKYCLEALSVNEVNSGLMIVDTLQGVPVDISASLIMNLLFGFGTNNYYRDVLVLFAFIAGFGLGVIGVVWFKLRERR
ncbi:hypothetical protein BDQ17DRAFT_1348227 [Cyathus striatus]|nr:hypothetical protein BDQ17DRAFT_1348227 [Cyathus striatus]